MVMKKLRKRKRDMREGRKEGSDRRMKETKEGRKRRKERRT